MLFRVPYVPHSGPPRDVTLRCDLTIFLYYVGETEREQIDLLTLVNWRALFQDNYEIDGVCRVESVKLTGASWIDDSADATDAEVDVLMVITLLGEDEHEDSVCQRMDDGWGDVFYNALGLPADWSGVVAGTSVPIAPGT